MLDDDEKGANNVRTLGYTNPNKAMKQHCRGVVKYHPIQTSGGLQELWVLNEPDVLRLIINSKLPAAQAFEALVFEEILPSIRKTGSCSILNYLQWRKLKQPQNQLNSDNSSE